MKSEKLQSIRLMVSGALLFAVCAFVFWSVINFDVLVKAIRYPEAVRELQVEVTLISPLVE